jgi:phosphoribosylformylglycinamidine synthase
VKLEGVPRDQATDETALLFSESASRFVVEVAAANRSQVESLFAAANVPIGQIGTVTSGDRVVISGQEARLIDLPLGDLKEAWQQPLRW